MANIKNNNSCSFFYSLGNYNQVKFADIVFLEGINFESSRKYTVCEADFVLIIEESLVIALIGCIYIFDIYFIEQEIKENISI
ncbi:hypothetical protein [Clostridium beijerinckii]|uniref:hypothetical protein n=1 Tax=Clostridium beijerinckii TaxID=1520 RepID=UPI00047C004E|nr:hypothetical protein [Clostridium beijerinckii]